MDLSDFERTAEIEALTEKYLNETLVTELNQIVEDLEAAFEASRPVSLEKMTDEALQQRLLALRR